MGDGVSKYVAVREDLLSRVRAMNVGERLPPEPALCAEYHVSRITLRHAVDGLITAGWLVREHGRGTFVSSPDRSQRYRELFADEVVGFHTRFSAEGHTVTSRVISNRVRQPSDYIAAQLRLGQEARVFELVRLRYVDGALHHLAMTSLPLDRFPGIQRVDFADVSLFRLLRERYDCALKQNDVSVALDTANTFLAEQLGVPISETLLRLSSNVYDETGRAVTHGTTHFTPRHSQVAFSLHA